jgi:chromosome segregation ATPase
MKERFVQLSELEKDNADLLKEKADLVNRVSKMAIKINEANENCVKVNKELAALTDKITKVQKDNGILKAENNRLLLQQVSLKSENDKATQASQSNFKLKDENSTPNAMVDELKANQTVHLVDGSATTEEDRVVLKENIKVLQEQNVKLQGALGEWTSLAKVFILNS